MKFPTKNYWDETHVKPSFTRESYDDSSSSQEQEETWFLGSLMPNKKTLPKDFNRRAALHNQITKEETQFDERYQANMRVASQLAQFFPLKWMQEITANFRDIKANHLAIKSYKDRISSYLGYIEILLTFRGLTLLDSTLSEINKAFRMNIKKHEIRTWKIKLLRLVPELRDQWIRIRAQTHQSVLISTVVQVMNRELTLTNCSKQEIFAIKQNALFLAKEFAATTKGKHIKKPEIWARALCLKALRIIIPEYDCLPFPHLATSTIKVVENKRWQLDQLLTSPPVVEIQERLK